MQQQPRLVVTRRDADAEHFRQHVLEIKRMRKMEHDFKTLTRVLITAITFIWMFFLALLVRVFA